MMKENENGKKRLPCKKIDIHTHLSGCAEKMAAERRLKLNGELGVERSVILPSAAYIGITKQPFAAAVMGNAAAYRTCLRYPAAFSWFCNVCPDKTQRTRRMLLRYKEQGARGVGEFASQIPFDNPVMEQLLAWCEELELPFLFHMSPQENWSYGVVDRPGLPLLEKELRKFPKLRFIGHSKVFWYELSQSPSFPSPQLRSSCPAGKVRPGRLAELFHTYPNLYGDLSAKGGSNALMRDEEYGLLFLREFQERLLFGTDILDDDGVSALGGWLDRMCLQGKLAEPVYRKICRDNAKRLLLL